MMQKYILLVFFCLAIWGVVLKAGLKVYEYFIKPSTGGFSINELHLAPSPGLIIQTNESGDNICSAGKIKGDTTYILFNPTEN